MITPYWDLNYLFFNWRCTLSLLLDTIFDVSRSWKYGKNGFSNKSQLKRRKNQIFSHRRSLLEISFYQVGDYGRNRLRYDETARMQPQSRNCLNIEERFN